jgi:hypothetical protein
MTNNISRVQRKDRWESALSLPVKTGAGTLRVEGYLTRSGIFEYRNDDGTIRREWRPADEVDNSNSLDSLRLLPITLEHPQDELVNLDNIKTLRVGNVGDAILTDTEWRGPTQDMQERFVKIRSTCVIDDSDAMKAVEEKMMTQFSCGYTADVELINGVTPSGETYNAIQRNIRYNHLALVTVGRAGADIAIRVDNKEKETEMTMKKIILDGVSFEAPEQTIEAFTASSSRIVKERDEALAKIAEQSKRADVAEAKADAATLAEKKALEVAAALELKIKEGVKARIALEKEAARALGDKASEIKFDELDDVALKTTVIKHVNPELNLEGKSADYISASFDFAVTRVTKTDSSETKNDSADTSTNAGTLRADSVVANNAANAAELARQKMIDAKVNAYKSK